MGIPNSLKILSKTSLPTESQAFLKTIDSWCTASFYSLFFNYLTNAEYRISCWPFASKSTLMTPNNFSCIWSVEYFKYLGSMLTNDGRCTCEIKSKIAIAKAAFNKKKTLFTSKLDLNLRKKLLKFYIWSMALYGAETWTLRTTDQKYLESFEMWCWRRMEKIGWTDHVSNEEVLFWVNEQRDILHEIRKQKANWIGHILRRNCLLKQVIEGKIKGEMEETSRREIRRKKLLDDPKERTGEDTLIWRRKF